MICDCVIPAHDHAPRIVGDVAALCDAIDRLLGDRRQWYISSSTLGVEVTVHDPDAVEPRIGERDGDAFGPRVIRWRGDNGTDHLAMDVTATTRYQALVDTIRYWLSFTDGEVPAALRSVVAA